MRMGRMMPTLMSAAAVAAAIAGCGSSTVSSDGASAKSGSGGGSSSSGGGTYKIGVAAALTGGLAIWDQPAVAGLRMAVDDINAKGGLLGKQKIVLDVKDARSDPAQTAIDTKALISDGANLVVLPCNTDGATAGGRLVQKAGIPAITLCATSAKLRSSVGDFMFGPRPSDPVEAIAAAKYAIQKEHFKTVFTLPSPDIEFTQNIPNTFARAFQSMGGRVVGSASFSTGAQDFGAIIQRIKGVNPAPDAIETAMFEPAFPAFLKQMHAAGMNIPIIGASGLDTPSVAALGKSADGSFFPVESYPKPGSATASFLDKVAADQGKTKANSYAVDGYNLGLIVDAAAKAKGSTQPTAIRDGIMGLKGLKGVDGNPITFDYPSSNGMPLRPMAIVKFVNGKLQQVANIDVTPDDLKAAGF